MILLSLSALALGLAATSSESSASVVSKPVAELSFRSYKEWDILLPSEQFDGVGAGIAFPHQGGESLGVKLEGTVLWVDRDGDGECEAKVEPLERGQTSLMVFRVPNGDNHRTYAVRLSSDGNWSYSASGAMVGELEGTRVQLIDQNNNGRFNDFGEDAMIVGKGKCASFLSKVVNIDGKLFSIDVSASGDGIGYAPYDGPVGTIDMSTEHTSKARMRSVVVSSTDGSISFELSRAGKGQLVPAGEYTIHSGQVALGKGKAELRTGRSKVIEVTQGEKTTLEWGGPVRAEFAIHRSGDSISIGPREIWYYGQSGEEYSNFMPLGSSPEFVIKDKKTGEVLVNAKFPGNC